MTLADYLTSIRLEAGLSQSELVAQSGLTVAGYEAGTVIDPRVSTVLRLAKTYDRDPLEVFAVAASGFVTKQKREDA